MFIITAIITLVLWGFLAESFDLGQMASEQLFFFLFVVRGLLQGQIIRPLLLGICMPFMICVHYEWHTMGWILIWLMIAIAVMAASAFFKNGGDITPNKWSVLGFLAGFFTFKK